MTAITAIGRRYVQATAGQRARLWRLTKFGLVGFSGIFVNTGALALTSAVAGVHYVLGAVVATQASTTYNFALTNQFVFCGGGEARFNTLMRYVQFSAVNNGMLFLRVPLMVALTRTGMHYLASNAVSLVALFIVRFLIADRLIWRSNGDSSPAQLLTSGGSRTDV